MNNIPAKKSLGQNFLQDETILANIANSISTNPSDLIIEIGPGKGALTKYLSQKNSYLICYEIDTRLETILKQFQNSKTTILFQDFLTSNITKNIEIFPYENIYIIANIPYYITTPIIKKALTIPKLTSMTLLVQKEVANRFCAKPGSKDYGSLTVYLNYYFNISFLFNVKNTAFNPIPKVQSAVVNFTKKEQNPYLKNEEIFFKLINDSFKMKRKTLKNNLQNYNWPKIKEILLQNNLNEQVRAEEIPIEVFIEIANNI